MHNTTGWNRTNLVSRVEEVCACGRKREREKGKIGGKKEREGEGGRGKRKAGSPWLLEPICMRGPRTGEEEGGGEEKDKLRRRGGRGEGRRRRKKKKKKKKKRKSKLGERHSNWGRDEKRHLLENRRYAFFYVSPTIRTQRANIRNVWYLIRNKACG